MQSKIQGASYFPLTSKKWRTVGMTFEEETLLTYFRREATASVAEAAKSNTKSSIMRSNKVQDSFRGAGVV